MTHLLLYHPKDLQGPLQTSVTRFAFNYLIEVKVSKTQRGSADWISMITTKVKFKQLFPTKPFLKMDATNFTELLRTCLQSSSKKTWDGLITKKLASVVKLSLSCYCMLLITCYNLRYTVTVCGACGACNCVTQLQFVVPSPHRSILKHNQKSGKTGQADA